MTTQNAMAQKGGKKYRSKKTLLTKPSYPLADAVSLLPKVASVSFDATAEVHIRIGADMTQADQLARCRAPGRRRS